MTEPLSPDELRRWHAWKLETERVRARVSEDVAAATGLSDPDFGVLDRLDRAGGSLRQNALVHSMRWSRSRLSHHLTRMAGRGLVTRAEIADGVEVSLTPEGRAALLAARPAHATAVRRHLLGRLPEIVERLTE